MTTSQTSSVMQQLRRAALLHDGAGLTDGQLLECFIAHGDDRAFEILVRRHGPMVRNVCGRVLHHQADAEDAFQATFLILARKARSVRPRDMVANWLYGVAYHTALKARALRAKRWAKEKPLNTIPEPEAMPAAVGSDWRPILDQELSRLPDPRTTAVTPGGAMEPDLRSSGDVPRASETEITDAGGSAHPRLWRPLVDRRA